MLLQIEASEKVLQLKDNEMLDALKYVDFLQKKTPKAIAQKENGYPKHPTIAKRSDHF
jgi:hypothetical protein